MNGAATGPPARLRLCPDRESLEIAAAGVWHARATGAVAARGAFHVALAGGDTPRGLYRRLAAAPLRQLLPWDRTHVWFGDERMVPPDHPDSNYRMARETLLDHVPIPRDQIHPLNGAADPEAAAREYAATLAALLPRSREGWPRFDLMLLGMGADGHTASLFPDTPALAERSRPVVAVQVPGRGWRLSLTLPVIEAAAAIPVLVAGAGKAGALARVWQSWQGDPGVPVPPIARIRPRGTMEWLVDRAAAAALPPEAPLDPCEPGAPPGLTGGAE